MEERKLIKFGKSAYCVTIPPDWLRKNNLIKGDTLYIQETLRNSLEIAPLSNIISPDKDYEIIMNGKDMSQIFQKIYLSYLNGYSSITLKGNSSGKVSKIRDFLQEFIGAEIMEVTSEKMIIDVFWDIDNINIDAIIKRVSQITKSLFEDIIGMVDSVNDMEDVMGKKFEIRRQVLLARRALNYSLTHQVDNKRFRYSVLEIVHLSNIIFLLGIIGEHLINAARILNSFRTGSVISLSDTSKIKFRKMVDNLLGQYELLIDHYLEKKEVIFVEFDKEIESLLDISSKKDSELIVVASYFQMIDSKVKEIRSLVEGVNVSLSANGKAVT